MKISFVIPCYNSAKSIGRVVDEIERAVNKDQDYDYEIILVNDYSNDNTADTIEALARKNHRIKAILLAKNFGQPSAILAGFSYVSGDYIITSDDDGQTPITECFNMIQKLENENYDVVCARYTARKRTSYFRELGSKMNRAMSDWLIKKPKNVYMSVFFCARPFVVKEMLKYKHSYPYIAGLILRATQNIGNIDVIQRERKEGVSSYTLRKLLVLWLNGFTAFSIKPLRISVLLGGAFSATGFILAIVLIINKLLEPSIQAGWSSMMALVLVMGGIILLVLGMIGEYVGRIYMCINGMPQYVVKKSINLDKDNNNRKEWVNEKKVRDLGD